MADVRCNLPRGKATKRNSRWRERSVRIIEKQDLDQLRQVTIISLEKISVLYQSRDNEGYLSILYTLWRVGTRVILQYLLLDSIFNCFGITRVRVRRWFVRTDRCNYSQCFDDFRDATVEYNRVTLFRSRIYDCLSIIHTSSFFYFDKIKYYWFLDRWTRPETDNFMYKKL